LIPQPQVLGSFSIQFFSKFIQNDGIFNSSRLCAISLNWLRDPMPGLGLFIKKELNSQSRLDEIGGEAQWQESNSAGIMNFPVFNL
jgi:hypothetical protein